MLIASGLTLPCQRKLLRQINFESLLTKTRRKVYRSRGGFTCSCRRRLQVVFVTTEVAPWSKVGGMADVLAGLPIALAARGHKVMTVAPLYRSYEGVSDTGVSVPVEIPPGCGQLPTAKLEASLIRKLHYIHYYDCLVEGVHRVFVDHPLYREADSIYGGVSSYTDGVDGNALDIRFSILSQAALAAPVFLWDADMATTTRCQRIEATGADAARLSDSTARTTSVPYSTQFSTEQDVEAPSMPQPFSKGPSSCMREPFERRKQIIFVGNDWPCSPALLRLNYIIRHNTDFCSFEKLTSSACEDWPQFTLTNLKRDAALDKSESTSQPHMNQKLDQQTASGASAYVLALLHLKELKDVRHKLHARLANARSAFCIHNLAYQGRYPQASFPRLCLPSSARTALSCGSPTLKAPSVFQAHPDRKAAAGELEAPPVTPLPDCEDDGQLNWMRAAISECNLLVTVSPSYAQEISTTGWMSQGLSDLIQRKGIQGIMNGIDTQIWDPSTDPYLPPRVRYTSKTAPVRKRIAKLMLQAQLGLDLDATQPLFGFVGRLTDQKGIDVLLSATPSLLNIHKAAHQVAELPRLSRLRPPPASTPPSSPSPKGVQMVMLGTGGAWEENAVRSLQTEFPGRAVGLTTFDESLAHWMYAACDFMLVTSRFEPCGLVAQCAVRYGAVPVVTEVGGLKDLVTQEVGYIINAIGPSGDPLAYRQAVDELVAVVHTAAAEYRTDKYYRLQQNCMSLDVSWRQPAQLWEQALEGLL